MTTSLALRLWLSWPTIECDLSVDDKRYHEGLLDVLD